MRELVVLSGTGGTGKTTLVGSFAALSQDRVLTDCDVYTADLHLFLKAAPLEKHEFRGQQVAVIDEEKCIQCGRCEEVCRFNAIPDVINHCRIEAISCVGCGFCHENCREEAIYMREMYSANWFVSETQYGPLVHARLEPLQENSGTLITQVRQQAMAIAGERGFDYIMNDGPPGIGGPAISALSGCSLALLVSEPTLSGMRHLDRVIGICAQFNVPALACINKCDINDDNAREIESLCRSHGIEVVSKIPFDYAVNEALAKRVPVVEYGENHVSHDMKALWEYVSRMLY